MNDPIPFNDLYAQYQSIKDEIDDAIAAVIAKSAFIRGNFVETFEAEFAEAIGANACVSCANGTDALYIAMVALGLKQGDEVIVPAQSWIATSETVTQAGGKVVFCDIEPDTHTLDWRLLESKMTSRTVGIIPVHLYGQPADMVPIMEIARRHGLWVIEDCAQAHLAEYKGRKVGTFGNAATFSFYPGKNLGAMGDAGAIVTSDGKLAERMAMFARHGGIRKGDHQIEGINSRLDGLQAAILSVKLKRLPEWTRTRQALAATYQRELSGLPDLDLPIVAPGRAHVWHLFVVRHPRRDEFRSYLGDRRIDTVINYPIALPFLPAYSRFRHKPSDFPCAHSSQGEILSLPIYPEMPAAHLESVVSAIREFANINDVPTRLTRSAG